VIYYSLAACDKYDLARHVWEVGHWIEGLREEIHAMRRTNATRERSETDNILMYFYAAKPDHVIR